MRLVKVHTPGIDYIIFLYILHVHFHEILLADARILVFGKRIEIFFLYYLSILSKTFNSLSLFDILLRIFYPYR